MKVIKVHSCDGCPYLEFSSEGRETYWCGESGMDIAKERKVSVEEAKFSPITMTVIPEVEMWIYVLGDEKTEWDRNTIQEWCPLEDA